MSFRAYRTDAVLYFCNYVAATFPGRRLRNCFYRHVMKVELGHGAVIMSGAWIDCRGNLSIGENTVINQRCRLDNRGGLEIADNVSISPDVHLISADHDLQDPWCAGRSRKIVIKNRVFIGSRATILPGVTIGEGAVVAACACVTKSVAAFDIVAGVPAVSIKARNRDLKYTTHYERHFF